MAETNVVPNPHAEAAKALVEKIRALRAEVPRFVVDATDELRKLARNAAIPEGFLESASISIQKSGQLETASGTDATTLRDSFSYAVAYEAVALEAYAFWRSVLHSIRVEKARAGASALDIYAMARRLVRHKNGAELVPHVEDMRRKLRRGRRKATSQPAPVPTVTTGTVSKV